LELRESKAQDGSLRLSLAGTLDVTSAQRLEQRLAELRILGTPVRLDLAGLEAIDHAGVQLLTEFHADGVLQGWRFEIEPSVSPAVASVLRLAHIDHLMTDDT
jgi:anti-anti-sigma regulatory factor